MHSASVFLSVFLSTIDFTVVAYGQSADCPNYFNYSLQYHPPFSTGVYNLSYMRPDPGCRTFVSQAVEDTITRVNSTIKDRDLACLFENACKELSTSTGRRFSADGQSDRS